MFGGILGKFYELAVKPKFAVNCFFVKKMAKKCI